MNLRIDSKNLDAKTSVPADYFAINALQPPSLICFSHLRWDFVYQRPQHLISRFSKNYKVYFLEEAIFIDKQISFLDVQIIQENLTILTPCIAHGLEQSAVNQLQKSLLNNYIQQNEINVEVLWYYTPMSFSWSSHLESKVIIYDCMDELSAFKFAPVDLKKNEEALLAKADLVFTGGKSLYEVKKLLHKSVHAFPSSVDVKHFNQARDVKITQPEDQQNIPYPRLGFYGVIDERLDIRLLQKIAEARPEWHLVIVGPIVKIDLQTLPQLPNIHYLGKKSYLLLPNYLAGWNVALLPFALNEATRFISPTKTPEYLAAGKAVVSTPITDVINDYQDCDIVRIAHPDNVETFIQEIENSLNAAKDLHNIFTKADSVLKNMSWDKTHQAMYKLILASYAKEQVA